ncbi:alpha-L-glutamate ligase [Pontibacillus yanchengensis]|uniref:Alpha-L-glutamate ligase n=1 Tax=Pontibacillus yanchengensis TaxID=462910 RepID=A0A6I5A6W4_9BACI|nr:alpha-L-glutamate ligase [Pontibacillus yanchengensis]MYL36074.1 alpha-L-glutamate ligase [Pontibacillus yanchengensis]
MSKVYILHENEEWTVHLTDRLDQLGIPYESWHLDYGTIDLSKEPPEGVFYNRMSASSHTRNHRFAPEFAEAVLAWLERHGRTVINGSRALRLEVSKVNQYMALNQQEIQTPNTITAVGRNQIIEAAKQLDRPSFITKHNRAGKGQGVQLFHSIEALHQYVYSEEFDEPVDGITLVQEYIEAPEPYIVRCEFIGGKLIYAVRVDTSEGFELCPADACTIEDSHCPTEDTPQQKEEQPKFRILDYFDDPVIEQYEQFLLENNIEVAGIECIQDQNGNLYTYDVNTNTNYNKEAEEQKDKFGMLELATYLGRKLEKKSISSYV